MSLTVIILKYELKGLIYNKSSLFIIETNRQVMFGGFIPPNIFKEVLQ